MAPDVDARAGVAVLPPGAAGTAVLLDDRERQSRLLQTDARQQAGLATPDDDHGRAGAHLVGDLVTPCDRAGVRTVEVKVLDEHRDDVLGYWPARQKRHHLVDQVVGRRRWEDASGVAERGDRGERQTPGLGHVLLGHRRLVVVECRRTGPQVSADPRRITGHVHERAEQGRDAHVLEHGRDGGVVVGERSPGVRIALGRVHHANLLSGGLGELELGPRSRASCGGTQSGERFSMNACMPSRGSGEPSSAPNIVW